MGKNHFTTLFNGIVPSALSWAVPPISLERAMEVFDRLADMEDIAFGYIQDGCYARTHIMCRRLMEMGLTPRKAWAFESDKPLRVIINGTEIQWSCHVAPALFVQMPDGAVQNMVIDPGLFNGPVSVTEWRQLISAEPDKLQLVPFGVTPVGCEGDYIPFACDRESIDTTAETDGDAQETMRYYLNWQDSKPRKVFPSQSMQLFLQSRSCSPQGKTWVTQSVAGAKKAWYRFGI